MASHALVRLRPTVYSTRSRLLPEVGRVRYVLNLRSQPYMVRKFATSDEVGVSGSRGNSGTIARGFAPLVPHSWGPFPLGAASAALDPGRSDARSQSP